MVFVSYFPNFLWSPFLKFFRYFFQKCKCLFISEKSQCFSLLKHRYCLIWIWFDFTISLLASFFFLNLTIHSLVVKTSFLMLENSMDHGFLWFKNLMEDGKTLRLSLIPLSKKCKNIWMNKCSLHQNNFEICWINLEFLGQCSPQTFGNHSEGYTGWKNHCC